MLYANDYWRQLQRTPIASNNYTKYAKVADDYDANTSFLLAIIGDIRSELQLRRDSATSATFAGKSHADGICPLSVSTGGSCSESQSRSNDTKYAKLADDYGDDTCFLFAAAGDDCRELKLRRNIAKHAMLSENFLGGGSCFMFTITGNSCGGSGSVSSRTKYANIFDGYGADARLLSALIGFTRSKLQLRRDSAKYAKLAEESHADGNCFLSTINGDSCGACQSGNNYTKYAKIVGDYDANTCPL